MPARAHKPVDDTNNPSSVVSTLPDRGRRDLPPARKGLTANQTANRLGMSVAWVKLHADELGGILTRVGYRFPTEITMERVSERITVSHKQRLSKTNEEGEVASKVFAAFRANKPLDEIVIEFKVSPEKVLTLFKQWNACGQVTATTLAAIHGQRTVTMGPTVPMPAQPPPVPIAPAAMPEPVQSPLRPEAGDLLAEVRKRLTPSE